MNEYQRQFVEMLLRLGVRFVVIGGQARAQYHNHSTRDLDLWVDVSELALPALQRALVGWKLKYPSHTLQSMSPPLPLRPGVQIHLPDAVVLFLRNDSSVQEIEPDDGIDVLTSVRDHVFEDFHERANWRPVDGLVIPFLAEPDLDVISPRKP